MQNFVQNTKDYVKLYFSMFAREQISHARAQLHLATSTDLSLIHI